MQPLPDGTYPYKGSIDCAVKTLAQEGPLRFYTGFPTYCIRRVLAWPTSDSGGHTLQDCPSRVVHPCVPGPHPADGKGIWPLSE
eukprot:scaffold39814_cov44-Prasinocladus_malaysianus.AAC.1